MSVSIRPPKYSRQKRTGRPDRAYTRVDGKKIYLAYLGYAEEYYRNPSGELTREYEHILESLKYLRRESGRTLASEFGPKMLKGVREKLINKGLSRGHINAQIRRIVCMFRWAVEEEIVPPATHQALAAVRNLKRGRSRAPAGLRKNGCKHGSILSRIKHLVEIAFEHF